MSKEMTETKKKNLFTVPVEDKEAMDLMNQDAENYVDDTAAEDITMPRITLLQSSSKQCKKSEAEYIKGAEEGDFYFNLNEKVIPGDEGFLFVPVKRRLVYLHWTDIAAGGGLIESFGDDPTEWLKVVPNDKGKHRTSDTTEIVKTHETFGYLVDVKANKFYETLIALASTSEKKQRKFNQLIRSLTGSNGKQLPEYAGIYTVTTTPEKNDQGSWFTWSFEAAGLTLGIPKFGKTIYNAAKDFAEMVKKDEVKVKYEQDTAEGVDEETDVNSNEPM